MATLAIGSLVFSATPVYASCNPGRADNGSYYWVGRDQTSTAQGIYTFMTIYKPYVKAGFSYAWVMLGGPGSYQWAQIGNYEYSSGTMKTVAQWAWSSTEIHQVDVAPQAVGSQAPFKTTFNSSLQNFYMYANQVLVASAHITTWTPAGGSISGEITTFANQMMGATSVNEIFDLNQIEYSGTWHTFNGILWSYNNAFGESGSGAKFDIWDGACSS